MPGLFSHLALLPSFGQIINSKKSNLALLGTFSFIFMIILNVHTLQEEHFF